MRPLKQRPLKPGDIRYPSKGPFDLNRISSVTEVDFPSLNKSTKTSNKNKTSRASQNPSQKLSNRKNRALAGQKATHKSKSDQTVNSGSQRKKQKTELPKNAPKKRTSSNRDLPKRTSSRTRVQVQERNKKKQAKPNSSNGELPKSNNSNTPQVTEKVSDAELPNTGTKISVDSTAEISSTTNRKESSDNPSNIKQTTGNSRDDNQSNAQVDAKNIQHDSKKIETSTTVTADSQDASNTNNSSNADEFEDEEQLQSVYLYLPTSAQQVPPMMKKPKKRTVVATKNPSKNTDSQEKDLTKQQVSSDCPMDLNKTSSTIAGAEDLSKKEKPSDSGTTVKSEKRNENTDVIDGAKNVNPTRDSDDGKLQGHFYIDIDLGKSQKGNEDRDTDVDSQSDISSGSDSTDLKIDDSCDSLDKILKLLTSTSTEASTETTSFSNEDAARTLKLKNLLDGCLMATDQEAAQKNLCSWNHEAPLRQLIKKNRKMYDKTMMNSAVNLGFTQHYKTDIRGALLYTTSKRCSFSQIVTGCYFSDSKKTGAQVWLGQFTEELSDTLEPQ